MKKVLFLDRDGIINRERGGYTWRIEDFSFVDDVIDAMKLALDKGFEIIVITNQGGIAKGIYSVQDVDKLHHWMIETLASSGVKLLDVCFCPHHDEIAKCLCRKPGSLMLEKAVARYGASVDYCIMIGDNKRDVIAAEKVGIKGILVPPNSSIYSLIKNL